MAAFYEVPVTIELDEESMCVYIKVYADTLSDAAEKAVAVAEDSMVVYADEDDTVKI
jgi:hypothetical protein